MKLVGLNDKKLTLKLQVFSPGALLLATSTKLHSQD